MGGRLSEAQRRKAACCGAPTAETRCFSEHMAECRLCKTEVRWDLIDHPVFGFAAGCDFPAGRAALSALRSET